MDSTPPPSYKSYIIEPTSPPQCASSAVGSVPQPQHISSTVNSIPPFYYPFGSVYGISPEVDEWITDTAPDLYLYSCAKISYLTNAAKMHKSKLTPLSMTRVALRLVLRSRERDCPSPGYRPTIGLGSLPAAVVHDIVKHLARVAIISQSKSEYKKVENEVENEILESLSISLDVVKEMLVTLGLETPETVRQQMLSRGYYMFLALARFLEAYGSRFAPSGTVYLTSWRRLLREHWSSRVRLHFDQIHSLKEDIISLPDAPATIEQWIPSALQALKRLFLDQNENHLFSYVLQRLS